MIQVWKKFGVVLVLTVTLATCARQQVVYNVDQDAIPPATQQKLSSEQVGKVIAKAALAKGWTVKDIRPGKLHCMLKWRDHTATIDITYSKKEYSIELNSSENLQESDGMIHRRYNEYVRNLQNEIDTKLFDAAYN